MRIFILLILLFSSTLLYAQEESSQNEYLLADNYFRDGEFEKAIQIYKKLYDNSPFNTTYLKRLVTSYQENSDFLAVENLLNSKLKKNPNLAFLFVFLGYNFERQQEQEKAIKNYDLAISSLEEQPNYSGYVGAIFKEYSKLNYALKAYEKGIEKTPNANYSYQIAQIYGEQGLFEKMFESYINLVDNNPNYLNTIQRFVSQFISDDAENTNNILFRKTVLRKAASNPKAEWNILLSWLFSQQKDYGKALIQEKALFQREETTLLNIYNLGIIAFNNKDLDASKACFDFVIENSQNVEDELAAKLYNIKISIERKQVDTEELFLKIFEEYGKTRQTLALQVEYADYLTFTKNEPEKAKLILEEGIKFANSIFEEARIKLKLGDILVYTGRFNKALIYFSQIQTQLKNDELGQEARFKVAETSYFKGDFSWAKAQLKVLKGSTTQLIANDAASLFLTITDNEPVDSIASGLTQYAKADLLAFQNKNQEAIALLSEVILKFKGQPIEDEALFKQAKLFVKENEFENAITNFEKVIAFDIEGILIDDAYYELAELYLNQLQNQKKASEYYQKIVFDFGTSIYVVDARKKYRKIRGDSI